MRKEWFLSGKNSLHSICILKKLFPFLVAVLTNKIIFFIRDQTTEKFEKLQVLQNILKNFVKSL